MLVRRLHKRGANIVVEANGEVLFLPEGPIAGWQRRFTSRAVTFSASFAPVNKRPRWGHYGRPLKDTFSGITKTYPGRMKVHSAVGSSAPHAYYVDQGTKSFMAKILPPWTRNSPSLYEHTWKVPHSAIGRDGEKTVEWEEVGEIHVRGQRGQEFFDRGLKRAFESMRMRSYQVPGDPRISGALSSFPEGLADFVGNTVADGAFIASLEEWRAWRDAAWYSKRILGLGHNYMRERREFRQVKEHIRQRTGGSYTSWQKQKELSRERSRRYRERKHEMRGTRKKERMTAQQRQARNSDRAAFIAAMMKKYGKIDLGSVEYRNGYWYVLVIVKNDAGKNEFKEVRAKAKT